MTNAPMYQAGFVLNYNPVFYNKISITRNDWKEFDKICKHKGTNRSAMIRQMIAEFLKKEKEEEK